jgi:hypothetical protein
MRCIILAAFLLCVHAHLIAQPVDLCVSSLYEWPRKTESSWTLSAGEVRLLLKTETGDLDDGFDPARDAVVAVMLPWMRLGPLRATGVMREASDPLGFTAWSGVFRERTGLAVKSSLPAGEQGFLCMPIPDDLGLFCVPLPEGGLEYGCFCSLPPRGGVSAEGFISLSRPEASEPGEEWYCTMPAFPGGSLLDAAARLLLRLPSFVIAATAGASSAERAEPGMFGHLCLSTEGRGVSASLLIGGADAAYRTPEGEGVAAMLVLSMLLETARAPCTARLGYTAEIGHPGFAPMPVLPTRETATMTLARILAGGRETAAAWETTGSVEARKSISFDTDGCRAETARYCALIRTAAREGEGRAEVSWSDDGGWGCALSFLSAASAGVSLGLDAELGDLASEDRTGSALARIQYRGGESAVSVRAGLDACPLRQGAAALAERFILRISWTQRARPAGAQ